MKLTLGSFTASLVALSFGLPFSASALIAPHGNPAASHEAALQHTIRRNGGRKAFPYWKNVGRIDRSTGVYLGRGYVLTAAHVGVGTFRTWDGRRYSHVANSVQYFRNRDGSLADICLFKLRFSAKDPIAKLPSIPLTTVRPQAGAEVLLIGGGAGRRNDVPGFRWSDDYQVRWGFNTIQEIYQAPMPTDHYSSYGYATRFDRGSMQCQAAPGDSGGAVFRFNQAKKRWELAGVIVAVDSEFGSADYGNQTYIADPAVFHKQLLVANGQSARLKPVVARR